MVWDDDKSTAADPNNPASDEQLTADEWDNHVDEGHWDASNLNLGQNGSGDPILTDPQNSDNTVLRYDRSEGDWVLPAVSTDQAAIKTSPASVVVYKDGSTIYAWGNGAGNVTHGKIASGTDAQTVIQAANDELNTAGAGGGQKGGRIFLRAGEYTLNSQLTIDGEGVLLVGDGLSWRINTGDSYGTILKAGADLDPMVFFTGQFSGAFNIGFMGDDTATTPVRLGRRDSVLNWCGAARATSRNVHISSNNVWVLNNWIEFSSDANIDISGGINNGRKTTIKNNFIIDGTKGIDFRSGIERVNVKDNLFYANDRDIQISGKLENSGIKGNLHKATGRNANGSINTCFYSFDELNNVEFEAIVDGNDNSGTTQTEHVLQVEGSGAITNDVTFDVSYRNLSGDPINNTVPVAGYLFNGRVPDPETINQSGSDSPISPTNIRAADTVPVLVDAGGSANTEVEAIDGPLARDEQTVRIIHTGGEAIDLVHNDTNESNPLINVSGSNETISSNGDRVAYTYSEQAGKWVQSSPVATQ